MDAFVTIIIYFSVVLSCLFCIGSYAIAKALAFFLKEM